jgi:hypothetical protein
MDSSRTAVYEFHRRRDTNLNRQLGVVAAAGSLQGSMLLVDGRCEVTRAAVQCPQLDRFSLLDRSIDRERSSDDSARKADVRAYRYTRTSALPVVFFLSPSCTVRGFEARKDPSIASKDLMHSLHCFLFIITTILFLN